MSDPTLLRVRPAEGLRVRYEDAARGHIPPEGDEVAPSTYYHRRIADGDLVVGDPSPPDPTPAPDGAGSGGRRAAAPRLARGDD